MTARTVNGRTRGAGHTGGCTLSLLATPSVYEILRALRDGPKRQADLRRETVQLAQSTLRAKLRKLDSFAAIEKRRRNRFPGVLEYDLTRPGADLLKVADELERWLRSAPGGPLTLGDPAGNASVKALADGWETTIMQTLAQEDLALTELDRAIASLNYPSVERRLAALRLAGLVEGVQGEGGRTRYKLTAWARDGTGPVAAAARWECQHLSAESF